MKNFIFLLSNNLSIILSGNSYLISGKTNRIRLMRRVIFSKDLSLLIATLSLIKNVRF